MKVEKTLNVTLTPDDIKNIVIEHLKDKHIIKDGDTFNAAFDTKIEHVGGDLIGHDTNAVFKGCTVTVLRK